MTHWRHKPEGDSTFVDVLTCETSGIPFGYRLIGAAPGPQVVVAGIGRIAEQVFDGLMAIPTLPWMRGTLVLVHLDVLDHPAGETALRVPLGPVDRTLKLPWPSQALPEAPLVRQSLHRVLHVCADMGMISGRGLIPRQTLSLRAAS